MRSHAEMSTLLIGIIKEPVNEAIRRRTGVANNFPGSRRHHPPHVTVFGDRYDE